MQAQVREAVYWPSINADIVNYVCWCTICTKHKACSPAHPILSRDIPDGTWQEITADYLTNRGKEYLLIYDLFSKYHFLHKVSNKSAYSLSQHLQELVSQYRMPCLLHTSNGLPFKSDDLTQFLQHNHIHHITSSSYFPRSNGFIE